LEKLATNDVVGKDALAAIAKRVADEAAKSAPAARATDAAAATGRVSDEAAELVEDVEDVRRLADEAGVAIDEELITVSAIIAKDIDEINNLVRVREILNVVKEKIKRQSTAKLDALKEKIGVDADGNVLKDYESFEEFAKAYMGMGTKLNGEEFISVERYLNFLTSGGARAIADSILTINRADPKLAAGRLIKLMRNKFPTSDIAEMSKAESIEEIYMIMNKAIAAGTAKQELGKFKILKGMSKFYNSKGELNTVDGLLGKVNELEKATGLGLIHVPYRVAAWSQEKAQTLVPWAYAFDTNMSDDMTYAVNDLFEFAAGMFGIPVLGIRRNSQEILKRQQSLDPKEFRKIQEEYVGKMALAKTADERRDVWYEAQQALVMRAADHFELDDVIKYSIRDKGEIKTHRQHFLDAIKTSAAFHNDNIKRIAKLEAERQAKKVFEETGETLENVPEDAIILTNQLSTKVGMINPYELRIMLRKGKSIEMIIGDGNLPRQTIEALRSGLSDVYDRFFKRSMLFRFGYVARNIMETQMRMYLNGQPSAFTNPNLLISTLFGSKYKGVKKLVDDTINSRYAGELDVKGRRVYDELPDDASIQDEIAAKVFYQMRNQGSWNDPGAYMDPARGKVLGYDYVTVDSDNYIRAHRDYLYGLLTNEMFRVIVAAKSGRAIPKEITTWAESKKVNNLSLQEQIVEFYWSGPGSEIIDKLRNAQQGKRSGLYSSREKVNAYLFGDEGLSITNVAKALTDNYNAELIDFILDGRVVTKSTKILDNGTEVLEDSEKFITRFDGDLKDTPFNKKEWDVEAERILKPIIKAWKENPELKRIDSLPFEKYIQGEKLNFGVGDAFEILSDGFFRLSATGERAFARIPEFGFARWEYVAKVIVALSPEDAQKVLAVAKKTLKGQNSTWGRETYKAIEANAKKASGDGYYTIDDLNLSASRVAARKVAELFYDASKRNAFGHALRFISPFGQAWANSMIQWTKLIAKNPWQVYKAKQTYQALTDSPPDWLGDTLNPVHGDSEDEYAPIISTDPKTGEKVFTIPLFGQLVNFLNPNIDFKITLSSMNMVAQNNGLPGFGPALQIPFSFLEGNTLFNKLVSTDIRRAVSPYLKEEGKDFNILDALLPAYAKDIFSSLPVLFNNIPGVEISESGIFSERAYRYVPAAMSVLLTNSPEKYINPDLGYPDAAGITRLTKDAQIMSMGLVLGRGMFQFVSPGTSVIDAKIKDNKGNYMALGLISSEFFELRNQGYDQGEALQKIIDEYGINAFSILITANTFGVRPTTEAYQAILDNPELLDTYGENVSFFYPGDGISLELARMTGGGGKKENDEILDSLTYVMKAGREAELNNKLIKGEITEIQYENSMKQLKEKYGLSPQGAFEQNRTARTIEELRYAVTTSEQLANTNVGQALGQYLTFREQAIANGGITPAQTKNREILYNLGLQLAVQYPEFVVVWNNILKKEIEER
jgi:hypothetical protein